MERLLQGSTLTPALSHRMGEGACLDAGLKFQPASGHLAEQGGKTHSL
jgi:hypothetical protein